MIILINFLYTFDLLVLNPQIKLLFGTKNIKVRMIKCREANESLKISLFPHVSMLRTCCDIDAIGHK